MKTGILKVEAKVTHFVVQGYQRGKGKALRADEPKIARSHDHCIELATRLAPTRLAVVAFSRRSDPDTGDYDDPVVLATFGEVPEFN